MDKTSQIEFKIEKTPIEGLLTFERPLYPDARGFYQELGRIPPLETELGRELKIQQWALSYNNPGVLRGLHAEPQDKLITPLTGKIFIAIADIRPNSQTFGKFHTFEFDYSNPLTPRRTIVVSNGLANSFMTLGESPVEYLYAVTETYQTSEGKRAVRWNDPDLNIPWPTTPKIISNDDEKVHPFLRDIFPDKFTS